MKQWYYNESGEQHGPSSEQELRSLLNSHKISPNTFVWTEGMTDWEPANSLSEFTASKEPDPSPYAPPASDPNSELDWSNYVSTGPQIRPWIRYWARTCDFIAFSALVGFIGAFAAPQILEIPDTLFGVLLLAVFVIVEPALFAMWGTTPFKALLKVRVRNQDGSKLTFSQSLRRCLKVWIRGQGLGVPLISLITNITSYTRLKNDGVTSWDSEGGFLVTHREIGWLAVFILILALAGFIGLIMMGAETT